MIPTANEFIKQSADTYEGAIQAAIEFAKFHVTEAIKECHKIALQEGLVTEAGIGYFENAYPLTNIK